MSISSYVGYETGNINLFDFDFRSGASSVFDINTYYDLTDEGKKQSLFHTPTQELVVTATQNH